MLRTDRQTDRQTDAQTPMNAVLPRLSSAWVITDGTNNGSLLSILPVLPEFWRCTIMFDLVHHRNDLAGHLKHTWTRTIETQKLTFVQLISDFTTLVVQWSSLAFTHTGWTKINCTITAFLMYFQNVSPKMKFLYLFMNYCISDVIILS